MIFVSHQYDFVHRFFETNEGNVLFLRAERSEDGARTFKLREGEPLTTSFGADVYDVVFGS